ncbi:hypothetical protein [Ramlibacter sp.]|uniref:hypothetical protein n=1 Tax=Ramlibacter sp. TaxID=1917967 RepID=UPI003D0EBA14
MPTDASKGQTIPVQGETQERVPRAPHERDESAGSPQGHEPSGKAIGTVAHDDLKKGRTDTDRGPVLDATYEKEFRKG